MRISTEILVSAPAYFRANCPVDPSSFSCRRRQGSALLPLLLLCCLLLPPPLSVLRVLRVERVLVLGVQVGCRCLVWDRCRYSYICYAAFLATAGREEHSRDRFARMVLGCVCACVACVSARAKLLFDLNKSPSTGRQQIPLLTLVIPSPACEQTLITKKNVMFVMSYYFNRSSCSS